MEQAVFEMKLIPCRLAEARELLDLLPGQRAAALLTLPKPGVKIVSCGCAGPGGLQGGCMGSALRGFAGGVISVGDARPGRAGHCCAGAAVFGGKERERGIGWRRPGTKQAFGAGCACPRGRAGGISQLRCPGQAWLHRQSSDAASEPRADSWSTCHRAATDDAATRCKCH